ncbi:organomercurial lyase [Pseudonocardia spinosispora]|uniref:organomercurial lyase n=1 Tax=Pseudonocardia spinosispora TaxID=103441 RepID=UPI000408E3EB
MHQTILRALAAGAAPDSATLERSAAPFGIPVAELLRRLHERDVIRLDHDGNVRAAYPFSATPTGHRVQLPTGPSADAMCMADALGIPAMLNTDATITITAPGHRAADHRDLHSRQRRVGPRRPRWCSSVPVPVGPIGGLLL